MGCLGGEDGESDIRDEGIRNGFGGECSEIEYSWGNGNFGMLLAGRFWASSGRFSKMEGMVEIDEARGQKVCGRRHG